MHIITTPQNTSFTVTITCKMMASHKIFYLLFICCNVCYEYQSEAASVPPANTTASQGKGAISTGTIVAIVVPSSVAVLIFMVGLCCLIKRIRNKYGFDPEGRAPSEISTVDIEGISTIKIRNIDSLQSDFRTIEAATNNFSADNKIGSGGFGEVYKGMLLNGQEIAVKRLYRSSRQGEEEFKNEVESLAKLKHRNLVRLLGFCVQGVERILVYEYVPNKSLDYILFDPEKKRQLDWIKRYKIAKEIARGIKYLHEDSRLKVIHRDLKVNNILLDNDMNPKISDFGMAIIFSFDQTQGNSDRICGTYRYMSPEYAMLGEFSVKSDVYSFGVILIEIISGKNACSLPQIGNAGDLLSYAWRLWKDGKPLELLDPAIRESYTPNEAMRCIHISLLCVQDDPANRPSMSSVVLMLENYPMTLPTPLLPRDPYWRKNFLSGQSTAKLISMSVNDMSVSEVIPR